MKEVIHQVRKAYITKLSGNVLLRGASVPIYNRVPSDASFPYIRIYSVSNDEIDQNQTKYITEVITRLEIVTRFTGDSGGELDSNLITDEVLEIVRTRTSNYIDLSAEGFNVFTTQIESINYLEEDASDYTYYRVIIEVSNRIEQISVQRPFIFTVRTYSAYLDDSNNNQFKLPLTDNGTVDILVDWGDGTKDTITAYDQAEKLHTYSAVGQYEIKITGTLQGFNFIDSGSDNDKRKILEIKNWGILDINTTRAFQQCFDLISTATDVPIISTTSLNSTFRQGDNFIGDLSKWNVSNVTNLDSIFNDVEPFNSDITNWNTSNVTSMTSAFKNTDLFNQNISSWDVSNVTFFRETFRNAIGFNQPIGNWTILNGGDVNMQRMLQDAINFDQSLADWDMTSVGNLSNFLNNVTLSTANYDATLIGWAAQSLKSDVNCDFGNSQYTAGGAAEAARNTLVNTYNWTLTDGGAA